MKSIRNYLFGIFIVTLIVLLDSCSSKDCKFNGITSESLPVAYIQKEYSTQLGYDVTCSFTSRTCELISGNLPPGITFDGTGKFSGIPSEEGVYKFTVKMTLCFSSSTNGASDCNSHTKDLTIIVK